MSLVHIQSKEYFQAKGASNSALNALSKCPAALFVKKEDTKAMAFGRAVHCYVIEGDSAFAEAFAVAPVYKRTNAGKALRAEFEAMNDGKEIITSEDMSTIIGIRASVMAHPVAAALLKCGSSEVSAFFKLKSAEGVEVECKSRFDFLPLNMPVIVDLKTTEDASPEGFRRSVVNYGYHQQAAFYLDGINAADSGAEPYDSFAFIAVEKKEPYRCEVYTLSPEFIERGRSRYKRLLDEYAKIKSTGIAPAYLSAEVIELDAPGWLID